VKTKPNVYRFIRGGCWYTDVPSWLRGADRGGDAPSERGTGLGFRPALDSPKEKR